MHLLTGATGQIGHRLLSSLQADNQQVRVLGRKPVAKAEYAHADLEIAEIADLKAACTGIDTLYHCAGYAHAFKSLADADAKRHWRINFEATSKLVEAAGQAGLKRFIFVSSAAVSKPGTNIGDEFSNFPADTTYGQAKQAAEQAVSEASQRYGMESVIIRPVMVYGGGRGNLERMAILIRKGYFPPIPETGNKRSLVHVDDVVDALRTVARDARANGNTYIVADSQPYSVRELYDAFRQALGLPPTKLYVPYWLLATTAVMGDVLQSILKKRMPLDSEMLHKLFNSACYSPARIERDLGWRAQIPLTEGIQRMLTVL